MTYSSNYLVDLFLLEKTKYMNEDFSLGLSLSQPILLKDIPVTYAYLRAICKINNGLSYVRVGAVVSPDFPELLDKYELSVNGVHFCFIFIYSYHVENLPVIPSVLKNLNPTINSSIFNGMESDVAEKPSVDKKGYLNVLIDFILIKNGILTDEHVVWTKDKESSFIEILGNMGFVENFESLVLEEWYRLGVPFNFSNATFFKQEFTSKFHHTKISRFTPDFIQNRNNKMESAFNQIKETINRIQAWQDNEKARIRIETNHLKSLENYSYIYQITTPFITVHLGCDAMGRYQISFGLDCNYLKILPDDMASTLIRRIYEFTPGEMEPFVSIIGFDIDCIGLFESLLQKAKNNVSTHNIIEVSRHKEKSIEDMLNGLDFKDDVDDETKKWFNK